MDKPFDAEEPFGPLCFICESSAENYDADFDKWLCDRCWTKTQLMATGADEREPHIYSQPVFQTPPSRKVDFQVPRSMIWETWLELLVENPGQWARLPLDSRDNVRNIKKELSNRGVETTEEDGGLFARYRQASPPPPYPTPVAIEVPPQPTNPNTPGERVGRILRPEPKTQPGPVSANVPGHLSQPAITPLDGRDVLDDIPGPIFGEG